MNVSKQNTLILEHLQVANSFFSRGIGLLLHKHLRIGEGLWITGGWIPQNSIHTFFMKFPIDCVFLDKQMCVRSILTNIQPWRLIPPQSKSVSVIELPANFIKTTEIEVGDQLYVGA